MCRGDDAVVGCGLVGCGGRFLQHGVPTVSDGQPIVELERVVLVFTEPDAHDAFIAAQGDPERLAWMRANFTDHGTVAALGNADSYATRLYDYAHTGRDQVAWVIERLRRDPASRSATITTFQPLTDTTYIPCVSLLDLWRPAGAALEVVVSAHSIDFGTKGCGNLLELAAIQQHVASALEAPVGHLMMTIKSAHIYEKECDAMAALVAAQRAP